MAAGEGSFLATPPFVGQDQQSPESFGPLDTKPLSLQSPAWTRTFVHLPRTSDPALTPE